MIKILLVGCGNMGSAMLEQWQNKEEYDLTVVTKTARAITHKIHSISATHTNTLKDSCFDLLILAVKPQMFDEVAPLYKSKLSANGLVISIAAGVSLDTLTGYFPQQAIIRAMPNLPATIAHSTTAIVRSDKVTDIHSKLTEDLLSLVGKVVVLDSEEKMDKFTAVVGSGPGYVFYFLESYIKAAADLGFSNEEAKILVINTVLGSSLLAASSEQDPGYLREAVTSKNGTTEAGLKQLMRDGILDELLQSCTQSAFRRAQELA